MGSFIIVYRRFQRYASVRVWRFWRE